MVQTTKNQQWKVNDAMKLQNESMSSEPTHSRLWANFPGLFLSALGSIILAWVAYLIWYDATNWGKDIALIFFGSRTGEQIDLGIGMKVIYYFMIGLTIDFLSILMLLRKRHAPATDSDLRLAHARAVLDAQYQKQREGSPSLYRKESPDMTTRAERLLNTRRKRQRISSPTLVQKKSEGTETNYDRHLGVQSQKQRSDSTTLLRKMSYDAIAGPDRLLNAQSPMQRDNSSCPRGFGYLSKRPKDTPIPQDCLTCQKLPKCMSQV